MNGSKGFFKNAVSLLKESKAITTLIVMFLIINMLITASVAWFSLNRKTDVEDMGMGLAVDDTEAVYKVYMYDLDTDKGTDKTPDDAELNIINLNMNPYDMIFLSRNKFTPAFAKIEILRNSSMAEEGTVTLTITRRADDSTAWPEAFSSAILRFTAFIVEDVDDREALKTADAETLYKSINDDKYGMLSTLENCDFSKTFVTHNVDQAGHSHDSTDTITLNVDYKTEHWDGPETSRKLNVYLYMSYDVPLIECFMHEHSDGEISLDDNTVSFDNDLKKITVSYRNKED